MSTTPKPPQSAVALELEGLGLELRHRLLFSEVSTTVKAGQIVTLLGKNGAGKSTLLRLCAGLLKPSRGTVRVLGSSLHTLGEGERSACVSYLMQHLARVEHFRVADFLRLGAGRNATDEDLVRALARFDAVPFLQAQITQMSGGEWMRVQLARVWLQDADVVLLDEPSAGLDLEHVALLRSACLEAAACGKAIVVATHDLSFASALAGSVWILDSGRLIWEGPFSDLRSRGILENVFRVPMRWVEVPGCHPAERPLPIY